MFPEVAGYFGYIALYGGAVFPTYNKLVKYAVGLIGCYFNLFGGNGEHLTLPREHIAVCKSNWIYDIIPAVVCGYG